MSGVLYTIGHGTRSVAEFADLLKEHNIKLLIDVRTVPRSRTNPQFNKDSLSQDLPTNHDVKYIWMGAELGGLRKMDKTSVLNAGWDNASFRGYADYMQKDEFKQGLKQLMETVAVQGPAAIMCAETVYFRCHRALISDALLVRGWQVLHIMTPGKPPTPHQLTRFAKVDGENITYPSYPHTPHAPSRKPTPRKRGGSEESERHTKPSSNASKIAKTARQALVTTWAKAEAMGGPSTRPEKPGGRGGTAAGKQTEAAGKVSKGRHMEAKAGSSVMARTSSRRQETDGVFMHTRSASKAAG